MAQAQTSVNPQQRIVDILGTSGPMAGQELRAQAGLDPTALTTSVRELMEQGIVTKDGNTFDVTPDYRVEGRDDLLGGATQTEAPTKATPAKAATAKKAPAKAPAKAAAAPQTQGESGAGRDSAQYYTGAMDTLRAEELEYRVEVGMAAAHANAAMGQPENAIVAEILERWCRRAARRAKSIRAGKTQVRVA